MENKAHKEAQNAAKESLRSLLVHHGVINQDQNVSRWLSVFQKFYKDHKRDIDRVIGMPAPRTLAHFTEKFSAHKDALMHI
jgi:hypothetical protein